MGEKTEIDASDNHEQIRPYVKPEMATFLEDDIVGALGPAHAFYPDNEDQGMAP